MWRDPWGFTNKIFEEMDRDFSDAEDMLNRMFRTVRESGADFSQSTPYYYGYQITVGPDGKPRIREFGNARPASKGLMQQSNVRQPLVDTNFNENIRKVKTNKAEQVIMSPAEELNVVGLEGHLPDLLEGRVVTKGDTVPINMMGRRIGFDHDNTSYEWSCEWSCDN